MFKENMKTIAIGAAIAVGTAIAIFLSPLNTRTPESSVKDEDGKETTSDKNMPNPPEIDDGERSKPKIRWVTIMVTIMGWSVLVLIALIAILLLIDCFHPQCNTALVWSEVCWLFIKMLAAFLTFVCGFVSYFQNDKMSKRDTQKLEYYIAALAFITVISEILQG